MNTFNRLSRPIMIPAASVVKTPASVGRLDFVVARLFVVQIVSGPLFSATADADAHQSAFPTILSSVWELHSNHTLQYDASNRSGTPYRGHLSGSWSPGDPWSWTARLVQANAGFYKFGMSAAGTIAPLAGNQYQISFRLAYDFNLDNWAFETTVLAAPR